MSLMEMFFMAIGLIVLYVIFAEKEKSWPGRTFGFVLVFGMFFIGEKLDGYWFFIGVVLFPLLLMAGSRLLFTKEQHDLKTDAILSLVIICFISVGKLL